MRIASCVCAYRAGTAALGIAAIIHGCQSLWLLQEGPSTSVPTMTACGRATVPHHLSSHQYSHSHSPERTNEARKQIPSKPEQFEGLRWTATKDFALARARYLIFLAPCRKAVDKKRIPILRQSNIMPHSSPCSAANSLRMLRSRQADLL